MGEAGAGAGPNVVKEGYDVCSWPTGATEMREMYTPRRVRDSGPAECVGVREGVMSQGGEGEGSGSSVKVVYEQPMTGDSVGGGVERKLRPMRFEYISIAGVYTLDEGVTVPTRPPSTPAALALALELEADAELVVVCSASSSSAMRLK